jgi:hypothetical protein
MWTCRSLPEARFGVDGGERVFFLDVGVEGVVHGAEVRVIDRFT